MRGISELNNPSKTRMKDEVGNGLKQTLLILGLIAAATIVAYSPVLFDFFAGDDFVHLTWLRQAIHHPELVLRNFHTSWLDGTTTKFYRPLISVFMYTDYLVWGTNGLGFRLTNLIFHLSSTVFIFLIVKHLAKESSSERESDKEGTDKKDADKKDTLSWAYIAAAIFALYPLHPEAVSWITGRVDSVVSAFCLASIWFYIKWRSGSGKWYLSGALGAMVLGLLSKEMAITLPAVFFCYELCFRLAPADGYGKVRSILSAIKPVIPSGIVLALYFVVRRIALGTFVGGYDNSLFFIANPKEFFLSWIHALRMLIIPINKNLLGSHSLITKCWEAEIIAAAVLGCTAFVTAKKKRPAIIFVTLWFILCLLPVYKIFAIADDLQGSRLAYLATAPLCILLASAFCISQKSSIRFLQKFAAGLFISLCAGLLWLNNQPWRMSGEENNALRAELSRLYHHLPGDPQVLFSGLPDQIDGAYCCRNSLDGMSRRPQMHRDIKNSLMVNPFEPIFPFGYLKSSIAENRNSIYVLRWDTQNKGFKPVIIPRESERLESTAWSGPDLKSVLSVEDTAKGSYSWNTDGSLTINTGTKPFFLQFNSGKRDCWSTDFIELKLKATSATTTATGADLLYANELNQNFELKRRTHTEFQTGAQEQNLLFALRGLPDWTLGGHYTTLKVLLPPSCQLTIYSIGIAAPNKFMPLLSFDNSGYMGSKGYLHLGPTVKTQKLSVDATQIPGASSVELEISRTNLLFEQQNPQHQSAVVMKHINLPSTAGNIELNLKEFPSAGIYELRAWAKDSQNNLLGVASDHIVISVDEQ